MLKSAVRALVKETDYRSYKYLAKGKAFNVLKLTNYIILTFLIERFNSVLNAP